MKITLISLGCSKNTVDSERLAAILADNGCTVEFDSLEKSDIAIINTCGFILDAKEESVNTILDCIQLKLDGRRKLKRVYVFGCLVVLNKQELQEELPEVDGWFGVNNIEAVAKSIVKDCIIDDDCVYRKLSTPSHYAYLKIAEGCNKFCSFCSIPYIRGRHVSRTKESILQEAQYLREQGIKELILISQDLTFYGMDLYHSLELPSLVRELSQLGFDWIRLHYAHPNEVTDEMLQLYNSVPNLCKYLDIPLQHISTPILKSMKRNIDKQGTIDLVNKIRRIVPDIAIRTAFIVGYPGETQEQFEELACFIREMKFDRVGIFTFSSEDNTAAGQLPDDVPEDIKVERKEQLLAIQQRISLENNQKRVGGVLKVLIDRKEGDYYIGRTEYDSPEVDDEVLVHADNKMTIGEFYALRIVDTDEFDLVAEV
jgi:ribosomal protein S12 methylthiotransferase